MSSNEIVPSLLLNSPATVIPSIRNSTDCFTQNKPLTTIGSVASLATRSTTSSRSPRKKHSTFRGHNIRKVFARKPIPTIDLTMADISYRLRMRTYLNTRLAIISDVMCFLGILGILLMIIDNELIIHDIPDTDTAASWIIKSIITSTTVILLGFIFYFHYLDLKLYAVQNSLEDCRIGLTKAKICFIMLEILICAIHPIPHSSYRSLFPKELTVSSISYSYTTIDAALGVPMFARLYLLGRSILFHSHLARNISLRSISCLNQVSINFSFLMKTYLEQWPTRCLLTVCSMIFLIGSWSLRACSIRPTGEHLSLFDAMWLFITTYTTIGYGDIFPTTYCARGIATLIGLIGLLSSALVISVLARKLLLTREEKYVYTFVSNTELAKQNRHQAANIVKFAIKIWYLKRQNKPMLIRYMQAQQKLFQSIHYLKQIKEQQRNSTDNCIGLHELMAIQRNTNVQQNETTEQITELKCDMKKIETKLNDMTNSMNNLQMTLNMLLKK